MIGIYKITNLINQKAYIGQSCNIEKRWKEHRKSKEKRPLYNSFKHYGLENFSFEVLYECEEECLDLFEQSAIILFNSKFPNGYNMTDGGGGTRGFSPSEETRKKISDANKGNPAPNKGFPHSDETKKKLSDYKKGKPPNNIKEVIGNDGTVYSSVTETMDKLGMSTKLFYKNLKEGVLRYKE